MTRFHRFCAQTALCIMCLCAGLCRAQQKVRDSLQADLARMQPDTSRIYTLNRIARQYISDGNFDTAFAYIKKAISLTENINYERGRILALDNYGIAYNQVGHFDTSLYFFRQALAISERNHFAAATANSYNNLAITYWYKSDFNQSLLYYTKALVVFEKAGDIAQLANVYNNMGLVYSSQGNYPASLDHHFKGLAAYEKIGDLVGVAYSLNNIANVFEGLGDNEKANAYYSRVLQMAERAMDRGLIFSVLLSQGNIYTHNAQYDKALAAFNRSLNLAIQMQNNLGIAQSYGNIAFVHLHLKDQDAALQYARKAEKFFTMIDDKAGLAMILNMQGKIFRQQDRIAEAKKYSGRALELALETGSAEEIKDAHEALSEIYSAEGNYTVALDHYKKYIAGRDSLFNEENTKKTVRSEMNFEFEKKTAAAKLHQEKKEAVAAAEMKKQRVILFCVSGFGLLILGFAIFAYRSYLQKKKANIEITRQKEIIEVKQKEILDSIYYARRIQRALIPSERYVSKALSRLGG